MTHIDMLNKTFGRLTVKRRMGSDKRGEARWLCVCECGAETTVLGSHLRSGRVRSCGCYAKELFVARTKQNPTKGNARHGECKSRLHQIWTNMKTRCYNQNNIAYQWYGALGVTVCEAWMKYENFRDWAISNGYRDDLTIERIDPFGNYEPSNCTWIPRTEQNKNKRSHPVNVANRQ